MSGDDKIRKLTESSLLMAVSIVLFVGAFIPLLGIFVAPFCPIPLCIITSRFGLSHGTFIAFVTVLCLSLVFSVVVGAAFIPFVFTGLLLGALSRIKGSPLRAFSLGIFALLAMFMMAFYSYNYVAEGSDGILTVSQFIDVRFDSFKSIVDTVSKSLNLQINFPVKELLELGISLYF